MIPFDPGFTMVFGEFGGKLLYHSPGSKLPDKYHLMIEFSDGSFLTEIIQLWGAIEKLYNSILDTVQEIFLERCRSEEVDLFGRPGGYERIMNSKNVGKPCPVCAKPIEKISYLGGSCYFCPACQTI